MKNNEKISIFGGTGFIGTVFCNLYNDNTIKIERNIRLPQTNNILYFISTVDNYNVLNDPFVDIDTNLRVLMETLDKCRDKNIDVVNFVSSWFVYGETQLPAHEESYCNPKGFYSITKRCAEQLLVSYCKTFGIRYRILRLGNVYGTTDIKVSAKKNALQFLINKLKRNEKISLYDGGNFYRNFIHVSDACRAIKLICDDGEYDEIYNIGSVNNSLFKDIIKIAAEELNSISTIDSMAPPNFHKIVQVKNMKLDTKKLHALGFKEMMTLKMGISELCKNS